MKELTKDALEKMLGEIIEKDSKKDRIFKIYTGVLGNRIIEKEHTKGYLKNNYIKHSFTEEQMTNLLNLIDSGDEYNYQLAKAIIYGEHST